MRGKTNEQHIGLTSCPYNFPLCAVQTSPPKTTVTVVYPSLLTKKRRFFRSWGKSDRQRVDGSLLSPPHPNTFLGLSTVVSGFSQSAESRCSRRTRVAGSVYVSWTCLSFHCTNHNANLTLWCWWAGWIPRWLEWMYAFWSIATFDTMDDMWLLCSWLTDMFELLSSIPLMLRLVMTCSLDHPQRTLSLSLSLNLLIIWEINLPALQFSFGKIR